MELHTPKHCTFLKTFVLEMCRKSTFLLPLSLALTESFKFASRLMVKRGGGGWRERSRRRGNTDRKQSVSAWAEL